jgi:hypothetical protein
MNMFIIINAYQTDPVITAKQNLAGAIISNFIHFELCGKISSKNILFFETLSLRS